jgi:hypothetical protein
MTATPQDGHIVCVILSGHAVSLGTTLIPTIFLHQAHLRM